MTEEEKARHRIALHNALVDQKFEPVKKMHHENVALQNKKTLIEQKAVAVLSKMLNDIPRTFEHTALDKTWTTLSQFPDISRIVCSVVLGISSGVVMFPNPVGALVMTAGFAVGIGVGHSAHKWIANHIGADTPDERSTQQMYLDFNLEKLNDVSEPLRHCLDQIQALKNDADIPVWFWLKCNKQLENTIAIQNVYKNHCASLLAQWKELSKPDLTAQKSIENLKAFMQQRGMDVTVAHQKNTVEVQIEPVAPVVEQPTAIKRFKL